MKEIKVVSRPDDDAIAEYMRFSYSADWPDLSDTERDLFRAIIATAASDRWALAPEVAQTVCDRIKTGEDLHGLVGRRLLFGVDRIFLDLIGLPFSRQKLVRPKLTFVNFTGADLSNTSVTDGDFRNAILEDTKLDVLCASDSSFSGAVFKGASLLGARFEGCSLEGADLQNTTLLLATLERVNLRGTRFNGAMLGAIKFRSCDVDARTLFEPNLESRTGIGLSDGSKVPVANEVKLLFRNSGLTALARQFYYTEMRCRKGMAIERLRAVGAYAVVPTEFKGRTYAEDFRVVEQQTDFDSMADYLHRLNTARQLSEDRHNVVGWLAGWAEVAKLYFVDALFGFGEKPYRILRTMAIVILVFAMAFLLTGLKIDGELVRVTDYRPDFSWAGATTLLKLGSTAFYFSVVTFTTLGYGDISPPGWSRLFAGAEAMLGLVLSALFVVTLTRKYVLD